MNCGLVTEKNDLGMNLKSISVEVRVQDHVSTVSSTLLYVNEEERPLEALLVFPLPADAAVCHFSAKIGEQEIVAEVQERETARDRYDDAVSSGQQAFLLEESAESPDVFGLSVGCLSPGQNAAVTIIYVTELDVQADHSLRFCLPAVLNPRYTPPGHSAVLLLLKSLPMGCYFNIYGFFPLLFIFTDGEVGNTKEVLDLVKHHVHSHRCFSFGIGEGASSALITGMAREGSGHAQFITGTDRMQPKVMQSLGLALQPPVFKISVRWTLPDGITVDALSQPIKVHFQGQRVLIYAQLKGEVG